MGDNPSISTRSDYGIDQWTFVYYWQKSNSLDEVHQHLAEMSKKFNKPTMPISIIAARAANYRNLGIDLKKMKRKMKGGIDVSALNEMISQIEAGEEIQLINGIPSPAAPKPPIDPLEHISDRLKKRRKS
jgi:hypothetical protein